ncbi:MAG: hypothetical protein JXR30_03645 [Alphaproteobacteria bacterium]|nr:hypothetical protein [Alphaproteobacteria bacterium]
MTGKSVKIRKTGKLGQQKNISEKTRKGISEGVTLDTSLLFKQAGELQFTKANDALTEEKKMGKVAKLMNFDKKSRWDRAA